MNPSYNANFGSQPPTQASASQVPASVPTPLAQASMPAPAPTPAPVISSGSGDVVLQPSGKKLRKWLWVGLMAVMVIVGLVVAIVILKQGSLTKERFDALAKYLETGDGTIELPESDEASDEPERLAGAIFAVKVAEASPEVVADYYEKLNMRVQDFLAAAQNKLDSNTLDIYKMTIRMLNGAVNYGQVQEMLVNKYKASGLDSAREYYMNELACDDYSADSNSLMACIAEDSYYNAYIIEFAFYDVIGCQSEGVYDLQCAASYYGEDYLNVSNELADPELYWEDFASDEALAKMSDTVKYYNGVIGKQL